MKFRKFFKFKRRKELENQALIQSRAPITGLTKDGNFGFQMRIEKGHVFMETGSGTPIIFCHGILGSFKNFAHIGEALSSHYRVIVPCMPMYDSPIGQSTVQDLSVYLENFVNDLKLGQVILGGNSMGGGAVLLYAIRKPKNVLKIMLFSSSGLNFIPMRGGFFKFRDRDYVRSFINEIFFAAPPFSDEEFEEVFQVFQDKTSLIRILNYTRSTKKNFLHSQLSVLSHVPTLIIWGAQDAVIPVETAYEFKKCMPQAELHILDECGHAPTYEKPQECLKLIQKFLD